ncbi:MULTISPECIES: transcription termination/antitermination NusG family protein [unclassified Adlercreutzia]|uniref:transcription termination/antitermination NusG family protein n=1 Tax=unclassified Adlercreutzia TaxID=2636013 RepID=UPI0013EC94E2|nr:MULTISPECIES: transcription termination/antitermination NusG family protein [unclassified Adlercreutzia]
MPVLKSSQSSDGFPEVLTRHAFFVRGVPWYVVQVRAGREDHARELIAEALKLEEKAMRERAETEGKQHAGLPVAEEVFVPKARVGVKRGDKWLPGEEVLMPGYLVAIARDPDALIRALRRTRGFVRVVRQDNVAVPLPEQSVRWLEEQTQRGKSAVAMSEGYIEDGKLHITSGPLAGREALVQKVNHRRKVAYLEIEAHGKKIKAQLGIKITKKKECKKKRRQK